jgi:NifU-like protein involved in Fe-S cluster formation
MDKFVLARAEKAGRAMESDMNTVELQRILGYLNIGLAIAHDSGVSIGHFGCGDFIQLAQTVNGLLLHSITPAAVIGSGCAAVAGSSSAPAGTVFSV